MGSLWWQVSNIDPSLHHTQVVIFITGGKDSVGYGKEHNEVLIYDPEEGHRGKWTIVGKLAKARYHHGMSIVPKETADYCV